MKIQVNTDHNIEGTEALAERVNEVLVSALSRFSEQLTRVEVHLSEEHSHSHGKAAVRCMIEARLESRQPTAVTHVAGTVMHAVEGAADKLYRAIATTLDRLHQHR